MSVNAFIYTLSDPLTNEVRYVGKTHDLKTRLEQHLRDRRKTHRWYWISSLLKKGLTPKMELLEEIADQNDAAWQESERFWIETLKFYGVNLINKDSGGNSGKRMHQETKTKLSLILMGHTVSAQSREKMSRSHIGKKRTRESVEKTAMAVRGVPLTVEHRAKIAASNTGKKHSPETIEKIKRLKTGIKPKPETLEKLRLLRQTPEFNAKVTGWKHTDESKLKMSAAHKARFHKSNLQLAFELR